MIGCRQHDKCLWKFSKAWQRLRRPCSNIPKLKFKVQYYHSDLCTQYSDLSFSIQTLEFSIQTFHWEFGYLDSAFGLLHSIRWINYFSLPYDQTKYGVFDRWFCNLIGCPPDSIFTYSDRSAFPCQFSLHILNFMWLSYNKALINWLLSQCWKIFGSEFFARASHRWLRTSKLRYE